MMGQSKMEWDVGQIKEHAITNESVGREGQKSERGRAVTR